jgi:hypothetical protein
MLSLVIIDRSFVNVWVGAVKLRSKSRVSVHRRVRIRTRLSHSSPHAFTRVWGVSLKLLMWVTGEVISISRMYASSLLGVMCSRGCVMSDVGAAYTTAGVLPQ